MRTRCPTCATTFRVTSAQLRAKAGIVRCGQCHGLFNAFDSLLPETVDSSLPEAVAPVSIPTTPVAPPTAVEPEPLATVDADTQPASDEAEAEVVFAEDTPAEEADVLPAAEEEIVVDLPPLAAEDAAPPVVEEETSQVTEENTVADTEAPAALAEEESEPAEVPLEEATVLAEPLDESVEESTEAARAAGLIAARELSETQAYNRWAAGTLTTPSITGFEALQAKPARWPFVLAALLLCLALLGQLLYQYRTEAVLRLPVSADLFAALDIPVPLPGHADLVSIEASDLQSDNARGLLVLQATLKNRAGYAQAWPALELTLTDTQDAVVARRVMGANDYLPPDADHDRFAANGETGVRLWIETRDLRASGYRLYIFYP